MGQAKNRGSYEDRVKQAQDKITTCTLLAIATDNGKPFFQGCAEVGIPDTISKDEFGQPKWDEFRTKTLQSILWATQNKMDPSEILSFIGVYLESSPTLWTERNYPGTVINSSCARTGHIHTVDIDNLGCVFEYDISRNPTTFGPKFMTPNEVFKMAKQHGLKITNKEPA